MSDVTLFIESKSIALRPGPSAQKLLTHHCMLTFLKPLYHQSFLKRATPHSLENKNFAILIFCTAFSSTC